MSDAVPESTEVLRQAAGDGDLGAMRELARRQDPVYLDAIRQACIDVLGEDPFDPEGGQNDE